MKLICLLLCSLLSSSVVPHPTVWSTVEAEHNKGWARYLADEPSEFHDLPLTWGLNTSLPAWLRGSYVKNGPGQRRFGDDREYSSYLDSWGKLHKLSLTGGQATISGRMIETGNYNKSRDRGAMVPTITLAHVQPQDW